MNENKSIRPERFSDYFGQEKAIKNLNIFVTATRSRNEVIDHILIHGPPGLGKTTLANIISNELNANIKTCSAPAIEKVSDIIVLLTSLEAGDVLFIDEIHRLSKNIEEVIYSAIEDYKIDIIYGAEGNKKTLTIDIEPFTLIGATTIIGQLSAPFISRFGIIIKLEYYNLESLTKIIDRTSNVLGIKITKSAAYQIAKRSRGTPRIANRLVKRIRDFAQVNNINIIDTKITNLGMKKLGIDSLGLEEVDILYIRAIYDNYFDKPVGIKSITHLISEDQKTIEHYCEPYLIKIGLIKRTSKGRELTKKALNYISQITN